MDIDDILQEFEESTAKQYQSTSASIQQDLITAMMNERMSPELLPYKTELLNTVLTHISNQQQFLLDSHEYGEINSGNGIISSDFKLQLMIIETDIERISYIVKLYLRTRLSKLNKFTIFYINISNDDDDSEYLSQEEKDYIHKYYQLLTSLYNNCFLKKLPQILTFLDDSSGGQNMIVEPDLNQFVFVKCITKDPIFLQLEDEELELIENGVYVIKYNLIKRYLEQGDLILV
ncbi:SLD5 [Candida pseudojiufengensis]|uniref:SLD5 n=1 Tax=Candida pseudojiufengensis TaxID=497109 RepID=UPI002224AC78|nr:SLD5 [Candida pseudojiufengensis]KAI5961841.1 SLD5 [Candida pseudojiufengensis]